MINYSLALRVEVNQTFGVTNDPIGEPFDLVRTASFTLDVDSPDELTEEQAKFIRPDSSDGFQVDIGVMSFLIVDAWEQQWFAAVDDLSGDYGHVAGTIWSTTQDDDSGLYIREGLVQALGDGSHIIILDALHIEPAFRGHKLGLLGMGAVINNMQRGCSLVAGYPMQPGLRDAAERAASAAGLTRYYAGLGFKQFDDCIVLDLSTVDFEQAWSHRLMTD